MKSFNFIKLFIRFLKKQISIVLLHDSILILHVELCRFVPVNKPHPPKVLSLLAVSGKDQDVYMSTHRWTQFFVLLEQVESITDNQHLKDLQATPTSVRLSLILPAWTPGDSARNVNNFLQDKYSWSFSWSPPPRNGEGERVLLHLLALCIHCSLLSQTLRSACHDFCQDLLFLTYLGVSSLKTSPNKRPPFAFPD